MMHFAGLYIGRWAQMAGLSLTQQALAILATYGSDAHLWMPGVGSFDGIDAANFIESTGTSAAVVDSPVGYVGDAGKTLGPELVGNSTFDAPGWWSLAGATISGGMLNLVTAGEYVGATRLNTLVVGKVYQVEADVVKNSGTGSVFVGNPSVGVTRATTGKLSGVFVASDTTLEIKRFSGSLDATLDNVSVREIVGAIPATQSTTASKPILRRGAVNRLLQTGFTGGTSGTVGSGAVAPTGWTFGFSGGTATYVPAASGQGNAIRFVATAGRPMIQQNYTVLAGMTYLLHMRVDSVVGSVRADIAAGFGGLPTGATQTWRVNGVAGGATLLQAGDRLEVLLVIGATAGTVQPRIGLGAVASATGDVTLANPQLETGSTASPYVPTTTAAASSPTGQMYWELDGTDDRLQLSAVPFQASDDSCVIAGVNHNDNTDTSRGAFSISGAASQRSPLLYVNNRIWRYRFVNDAAAAQEIFAVSINSAGTTVVVTGRKVGNVRVLRLNGVQEATDSTAVGATTVNAAQIGSTQPAGGYMLGNIGPVIAIKGTVSDADLLTLEKWVGSLSGVTIT